MVKRKVVRRSSRIQVVEDTPEVEKVNKSQVVREAIAKYPDKKPKEVAELIDGEKLGITAQYISLIKSQEKKKAAETTDDSVEAIPAPRKKKKTAEKSSAIGVATGVATVAAAECDAPSVWNASPCAPACVQEKVTAAKALINLTGGAKEAIDLIYVVSSV
jgi:hypothetical protein